MLNIKPAKILVGVNSEKDCEAALDFAVAEAGRRECGVHIVFALPPLWAGGAGVMDVRMIGGELHQAGATILRASEQHARLSEPDIAVSTEILHGAVVPALVDESENAALVVLQHHRMSRHHRLPTLSTTNGVAARAAAPVVAVPDTWRESDDHQAVVVAGVEDAEVSGRVAEVAFEEARRLGAAVHLVHAWSFSTLVDDYFIGPHAARRQSLHLQEGLSHQFAPLIDRFPGVKCEVLVDHGRPAEILLAKAEGSRLLVVGRHHPATPIGSHLGPVTHAVLDHSPVPVLVVDPRA